MEALVGYAWPGNVRELENMIERLVVLGRAARIGLRDLPSAVREALSRVQMQGMPGTLQEMERIRIVDALREAGGNKKLAAKRLGIHRSTLYAKLKRFELYEYLEAEGGNGRERRQTESESATLAPTS
jgi:two-component system response regulator HydG